jgi:hypothetical protein
MNQRMRDIDELLAGIYEGLGDREPTPELRARINRLLDERTEAETSSWHGWECYCIACCQ